MSFSQFHMAFSLFSLDGWANDCCVWLIYSLRFLISQSKEITRNKNRAEIG